MPPGARRPDGQRYTPAITNDWPGTTPSAKNRLNLRHSDLQFKERLNWPLAPFLERPFCPATVIVVLCGGLRNSLLHLLNPFSGNGFRRVSCSDPFPRERLS